MALMQMTYILSVTIISIRRLQNPGVIGLTFTESVSNENESNIPQPSIW